MRRWWLSEDFERILRWADELRTLGIRANADTPEDAKKVREFGAEGIGLCRMEHMLMEDGRLEIGRKSNPDLKLGICGEHGGDPESIEFFHEAGLDYVSCSPYRVPVARLAAAQAALRPESK